jgi:hypothetical protein
MEDRILDYFGDEATWDQQDLKIVVARYFYMEAEARLYAARLNQEGIPSFISNANTISVFPSMSAEIGLHVKKEHLEKTRNILQEMDRLNQEEVDFRDATHEEIEFQKILHRSPGMGIPQILFIFLIILIILILARAFIRARYLGFQFDPF